MFLKYVLLIYTISGAEGRAERHATGHYHHIDKREINTYYNNSEEYEKRIESGASAMESWGSYINNLIQITQEQFGYIKSNVINNYNLRQSEITDVNEAFQGLEDKYVKIMRTNINEITQSKHFNPDDEIMIEVMDLSNYVLEKLLAFHLKNIKGMMLLPINWYHQTLRDKIQRQQMKIATNNIENHVCDLIELCKERFLFSDYLIDWTRRLMGAGSRDLDKFFNFVPEILNENKHFIKSNKKFRDTIGYIVDSNSIVKRDTLDFVDEVLTNQGDIYKLTPRALTKSVTILKEMFRNIDDVYDVNDKNVENLENISEMFSRWLEQRNVGVQKILNTIVDNMKLNFKVWPLHQQNKVQYLWNEVIIL